MISTFSIIKMEVRHQPNPHHKKKIKEYFLENKPIKNV